MNNYELLLNFQRIFRNLRHENLTFELENSVFLNQPVQLRTFDKLQRVSTYI